MAAQGARQKGVGAKKLPKEGSKNSSKSPKRGVKLINKVTKGTKGMIFQGKKFLEENLQKNFQGVLFLR